jgi:predicted DNA-binding transcriptional regulator AlpA
MIELLTTTGIAEVLGVSRSYVVQLARRPDFPRPFATTRGLGRPSTRLWRPEDVERFARSDWRRPSGRPRKLAA